MNTPQLSSCKYQESMYGSVYSHKLWMRWSVVRACKYPQQTDKVASSLDYRASKKFISVSIQNRTIIVKTGVLTVLVDRLL